MQCSFSRRRLAAWCLAAGLVTAGCLAGPADARANAPELIAGAVDADGGIELVQNRSELVILDNRRQADVDDVVVDQADGVAKTTRAPFSCDGPACGRAAIATERAVDWEYEKVFYYSEGMTEWKATGLPLAC